ncbi:ferredoxin [Gordonia sp. SL306]|uniref:ferredoxin n=1 Tax=Gordonia sp. SL306 TaxID=2995145 RepID=UPI002270081D|nr:ferredoxin [Gordonia sp. SL306]WAC54184.1 ferredoxin [Gordonia sp. SL306]
MANEHGHGDGGATTGPRVEVDTLLCEGHGLCAVLAPDVFEVGDDDVAVWERHPPEDSRGVVEAAVSACPRQAITLS